MTDYVVEELNGEGVLRRNPVEADSAIEAAVKETGRSIGQGRIPGRVWIRVTDVARGNTYEFHFGDGDHS